MTAPPKRASSQEGFFWKTKTLEEMSSAEWESLCDGCARCCLEKLEDEDTGKIYFTHVSCRLLDAGLCACKDYANRSDLVPDCVRLTPANVRTLNWLPPSCGYKLVAEGRDLYWWHPLVSGDPNTVHEAGVSVRGRVQGTENEVADAHLAQGVVEGLDIGVEQALGGLRRLRSLPLQPAQQQGHVQAVELEPALDRVRRPHARVESRGARLGRRRDVEPPAREHRGARRKQPAELHVNVTPAERALN